MKPFFSMKKNNLDKTQLLLFIYSITLFFFLPEKLFDLLC